MEKLEAEVLPVIDELAAKHPEMGALVIECTDLPPFANLIQREIGIPVFDIITLTNMVYQAVVRTEYPGYIPPPY
jgi:Asp/Glu/hydantoin racemase